jgi:integrase
VSLPNRRRKFFYGKTKEEVRRKLSRALHAIDVGTWTDSRGITVAEFLDQWLTEVVRPNVRPWTYKGYEVHVRLHLTPSIGHMPLDKLTPVHVQQLLNAKQREGLSAKSIRYIRGTLQTALNQAVRWELLTRNPASLVDGPRVGHYEIRPFTPEEARTFLTAMKGDRLEALYSVALTMGLRQGEALGLCWKEVDLEMGHLRVSQQLQRVDGETRLVEPKTPRSRRSLALPASIVRSLREHRDRQQSEREAAGATWTETGLVFTTPTGRPIDATKVSKDFHMHLDRAGLAQRRFHDLRHSCATLLLVQGVSPRVVMEVLGHSQISLTMNTYTHVVPELRRQAADRMDELLDRSPER